MRHRIKFEGRVQGVGFRATSRHIAGRYEVSGWVRNEPDGAVLIEVQGTESEIEAFLEDLLGAMGSRIQRQDAAVIPDSPSDAGFEIKR